MTPEQKLAVLMGAQTPREPDRVFVAEAMRRVALRRTILSVMALIPWAIATAALLWALRHVLETSPSQVIDTLGAALGPGLGGLGVVVAILIGAVTFDKGLRRRLAAALSGPFSAG